MAQLPKAQDLLLTVGAVLGTICLLAAAAGILLGAKPLIFRSGSMEPAISTGSLALSLPVAANDIQAGDIVSVKNSTGTRITHRVVDIVPQNGSARLKLKGDANLVADAEPYAVTTADKVLVSVPLLGYAVSWLSGPAATFLGGLLTAYLLYIAYRRRPTSQIRSGCPTRTVPGAAPDAGGGRATRRRERRRPRGMKAMTVLTVAGISSGVLTAVPPARAAFTNAGNVATATFAAAKLPNPKLDCRQRTTILGADNSTVNLSWSHNNGATGVTGYLFTTQIQGTSESSPVELGKDETTRSVSASQISAPERTTVTFRIYSRYHSWLSVEATATATYRPPSLLSPATLTC